VEVQRGTASLFTGAGEPGITVNIARKRALAEYQALGSIAAGSWNNHRAEADVTGPLNTAGTLRARVLGVAQDYDTFMDGIDGRKYMAYGTLEADLGPSTTASVGLLWQDVRTVLSRGLPTWADGSLIDMPRSTMPVQDWNRQKLLSSSAFAEVEHRWANAALLKGALRRLERRNDARYLDPAIPAADGTMSNLSASAFERDDSDTTADLYFSTPWQWRGFEHHWLIGADWRRSRNEIRYAPYAVQTGASLNLFDVDHGAIPEPDFDIGVNASDTRVSSYGAYTQVRIKPAAAWTLIGGGRLSWWKSEGVSNGAPSGYESKARFKPYAAAIFDVTARLSAYASYSEIFKPQNAVTVTGSQIEPRTGDQVEIGLKGDTADGRLNWLLAAYRLTDKNRAIADPADDNFSVASGKARSQGIEAEVRGEPWRNWSITAGYAYTHTRYLRADPALQDTPFSTFTPRHNANLSTQYRFAEGAARGVEIGGAVRAVSDFYNVSGTTTVRGPGYAVFSVNAGYRINPNLRVTLNVDNLFDRTYWEKVSYPGRQNFFGEPRSVTVALRGNF